MGVGVDWVGGGGERLRRAEASDTATSLETVLLAWSRMRST